MTNEELDKHMNYERAKTFLNENIKVHITLKRFIPNTDRRVYYNGFLKTVEKDYLILDEVEEGLRRVFYFDINKPIVEFTEVKEWNTFS